MNNSKIKRITIVLLVLAVFIMSIAYANLASFLNIGGNANVISSWKVEITGIREGNKTTTAYSQSVPTYTMSTASFSAHLEKPDDSIEYIVTIRNNGDIDAKLDGVMTSQFGSDAIIYEIGGIKPNDVLLAGEEVEAVIKVSGSLVDSKETLTSNVTMVFNYIQNM